MDLPLSGTALKSTCCLHPSQCSSPLVVSGEAWVTHFPDPRLPPESSAEAGVAENWGLTPRWSSPLAVPGGQQSSSFMPPGALNY